MKCPDKQNFKQKKNSVTIYSHLDQSQCNSVLMQIIDKINYLNDAYVIKRLNFVVKFYYERS